MPHLAIEYSDNLTIGTSDDARKLMADCYDVLVRELPTTLPSCRGYAEAHDVFLVGNDSARGYVSVYIKVLAGRTDEVLNKTARDIFKTVDAFFKDKNPNNVFDLAVDVGNLSGAYIKEV